MSSLPNAFPAFNQPTSSTSINKSGTTGNLFVLILDESGSMGGLVADTIGGVNTLLAAQRVDPIKSFMKIVKFEGGRVSTIRETSIDTCADLTNSDYRPAGGTNLLDAVGQTIHEVNNYLLKFKEDQRPSVIFQITTDGEENSSVKYNDKQIKALIEEATGAGWVFTYIGANIDAFHAASTIGINTAGVAQMTSNNTRGSYGTIAASAMRMKQMAASGFESSQIYASGAVFTEDERLGLVATDDKKGGK